MKLFKYTAILVVGASMIGSALAGSAQESLWQKSFWRNATLGDVQNLIKQGVDLNQNSPDGLSPLALASMETTNENIIGLLVDYGADVNAADADWGWTPLFLASMNNTNPKVIDMLIKKGAYLEDRCVGINSTPLIDAVVHNNSSDIVMALLKAGADPYAYDDEGMSAIDYMKKSVSYHKGSDAYKYLLNLKTQ